jgi:hypothetical protein
MLTSMTMISCDENGAGEGVDLVPNSAVETVSAARLLGDDFACIGHHGRRTGHLRPCRLPVVPNEQESPWPCSEQNKWKDRIITFFLALVLCPRGPNAGTKY